MVERVPDRDQIQSETFDGAFALHRIGVGQGLDVPARR